MDQLYGHEYCRKHITTGGWFCNGIAQALWFGGATVVLWPVGFIAGWVLLDNVNPVKAIKAHKEFTREEELARMTVRIKKMEKELGIGG